MRRFLPTIIRLVVGTALCAPFLYAIWLRPEVPGGYGRWGEAYLYLWAVFTLACPFLVSELIIAILKERGKLA